jgi:hypothetical protein
MSHSPLLSPACLTGISVQMATFCTSVFGGQGVLPWLLQYGQSNLCILYTSSCLVGAKASSGAGADPLAAQLGKESSKQYNLSACLTPLFHPECCIVSFPQPRAKVPGDWGRPPLPNLPDPSCDCIGTGNRCVPYVVEPDNREVRISLESLLC